MSGTLTLVDGAGTQTVLLSGYGYSSPTDNLIPAALVFPATGVGGSPSDPLPVLLTNLGDLPLNCVVTWTGAPPATQAPACPDPQVEISPFPIPAMGNWPRTPGAQSKSYSLPARSAHAREHSPSTTRCARRPCRSPARVF